MLRLLVVFGAAATMAAALGTGFFTVPGEFNFTWTTGFFPPHRGYSAYIVTALVFLAPHRWLRALAGLTLALGGTRAAWVGVLAGWAWGRPWRVLAALLLAVLAVVGGNKLKSHGAQGDGVRVLTWQAALREAEKHPTGLVTEGRGHFIAAIAGNEVNKAHSDLLQLLVDHGFAAAFYAILALAAGLWWLPAGPWKELVVCLSVQSLMDNRLHHPACAALYAVAWLGAALESPPSGPTA